LDFALNANGVAAINSALGGVFAIGSASGYLAQYARCGGRACPGHAMRVPRPFGD
jgi:hypothetical protein